METRRVSGIRNAGKSAIIQRRSNNKGVGDRDISIRAVWKRSGIGS